jgi:hypothetical protein
MAEGPRLPRKDTSLKRTRETLEGAAHQIGVLLAIERNRWRLTQEELADELGVGQITISRMENGLPAGIPDDAFDALFERFELTSGGVHANFLKWWRDHATVS